MSEIRSGFRHFLAVPWVYNLFQTAVGANAWRKRVILNSLTPFLNRRTGPIRVLDIGCGPGEILSYLPHSVEYVGFDRNPSYIEEAAARFAGRNAKFFCAELTPDYRLDDFDFDVVLAFGLLHHLDDASSEALFATAKTRLKKDGMFLTLDPLFSTEQSALARYVVSKDRGQNIRNESGYRSLASRVFEQVECLIDKNPLWIPYTGVVLKCTSK
jgi:SAM-dependent methyltransferase